MSHLYLVVAQSADEASHSGHDNHGAKPRHPPRIRRTNDPEGDDQVMISKCAANANGVKAITAAGPGRRRCVIRRKEITDCSARTTQRDMFLLRPSIDSRFGGPPT